jgi:hypothetical protein
MAKLWLRDEVFEHGVLHVSSTDTKKVNSSALRLLVGDVLGPSSRGAGGSLAVVR